MKRINIFKTLLHFVLTVAMLSSFTLQGFAQTAAGTDIKNTASATYGDGSGSATEFSATSNEVVVTVAKVAGLTITPDAGTNSSVVPGQTGVTMDFVVTNTGNFNDQVRFLANGGSLQIPSGATATAAVILGTSNVNILTNASDVLHSVNAGANFTVRVTLSISASAAAGSNLKVFLGDQTTLTPTFDNDAANSSASEVNTVSTGAVNGSREARGDRTVTVENDAQLRVNLTAPAGPISLGSNINYSTSVCNDGARNLDPIDPDGAAGPIPAAIYVVAPIPAGTELASALATPAGVFYTTTALSTAPFAATWTSTAPTNLSTVTRILIPVSTASLTPGTCSAGFGFAVTVTTNNANTPISSIVDGFGENSLNATLTDQSGDNLPNTGDGNANFNEPPSGGTASPNQGFRQPTSLAQVFGILNGPDGAANATGPTDNNDDFTNKSVNTGIAGVAPGGDTTASGQVTFTNSLQNTGNSDDTYRLTAPTIPTGATVEIFDTDTSAWVDVSNGTAFVDVDVAFGTTLVDYNVRITLPSGITVLTGYDTVIRATSTNDATKTNNTINRLYTGFVRLNKTAVISGGIAAGGTANTDPIPGAIITYSITYTNISTAASGGSVGLTANNLVITENGNLAPNTWGANTDQVVGSATDTTTGAVIVGDAVGSTLLTDTIPTLAPQASGTFSFRRTIK